MRHIALVIACIMAFSTGGRATAADATIAPQAALTRLFTSPSIDADWFAPVFTAQVSVSQVQTIVNQLTAQLGAFKNVTAEGVKFRINFAHGDDRASIALDDSGRISGLFFETPQPYAASFQSALDAFSSLPGKVSVYVGAGEKQRGQLAPDAPLAVGSSFKLAVLAALDAKIAGKATSWQATIPLDERRKSLPSGILQSWPDGAPLTVYTYAALMISQSDNTAADTMLLLDGRSDVERFAPHNKPMLTTREAFILKDPRNAALLAQYRTGDEAARLRLLGEVDSLPLPDPAMFAGSPLDTDIEWFFTTRELCGLMAKVQHLALMSINPGLADRSDWSRIAYKGGSEPGVLNLTTWLVAKDGSSYCVSATWNDDKTLDELRFYGLYKSLLSTLDARR